MKKLISFLGNTNYKDCYYAWDGKAATRSRFVQTAIYEHFCQDFSQQDEVIVFVTAEAKNNNGRDFLETWKEIAPETTIHMVDIASKQDELHNWELFEKVFEVIDEEDEITFDITNSFRSFPIMALIILNYARLLKKAHLNRLLYGCFEERGNVSLTEKSPTDAVVVPIIDLTSMISLLDWTHGVKSFIRSGDASVLQSLTKAQAGSILSNQANHSKPMGDEVKTLRKLADQLDVFSQTMQTCRGPKLQTRVSELRQQLDKARQIDVQNMKPLGKLLDQIEEKISPFNGDPIMDDYEAAKWCLEHGLIQQGFTMLQESMITAMCKVAEVDWKSSKKRKLVSDVMWLVAQDEPRNQWRFSSQDQRYIDHLEIIIKKHQKLLRTWRRLTKYRNNLNHAGWNEEAIKGSKFKEDLKNQLAELKPFFTEMSKEISTTV